MECPLLGSDVRQAAHQQRDLKYPKGPSWKTPSYPSRDVRASLLTRNQTSNRFDDSRRSAVAVHHVVQRSRSARGIAATVRFESGKRAERGVETRPLSSSSVSKGKSVPCRFLPTTKVDVQAVNTESIFPLKSRNYKVSATVGVSTVIVTAVRAILDTGSGPNLVREDLLPEDWEQYRMNDEPRYNVVGAGGKRLRQKGVISLFVELGRLRVKARFLVIAELAAECILGCQFIDRHVQSILPKEKRI
jgi:hypothetical protein